MLSQRQYVGITGHQDLGDRTWVKAALNELIESEDIAVGLTSLARGADQIFAQCLISAGRSYRVIIPSLHYETAFEDSSSLKAYRRLLSCAECVETLQFKEPSGQAFFAAGKRIVDETACILAVWNGQPAKGLGGTADVVDYAKSVGRRVIHVDCDRRIVTEIVHSSY